MSAGKTEGWRETARQIEQAADLLGSGWPGWQPIQAACREFRRDCEQMATHRGLPALRVAFIGPKKAGKSTLLKFLVSDGEVRDRLDKLSTRDSSTEKLVWVGAKLPVGMVEKYERYVPCSEEGLAELGQSFMLVDVPGDNEADAGRHLAAQQALKLASVKVLVVSYIDRYTTTVTTLAQHAGHATILPVLTQLKPGDDRSEVKSFVSHVQAQAPTCVVLPPLVLEDFDLREAADDVREKAALALQEALRQALPSQTDESLVERMIEGHREAFTSRVAQVAAGHLPATAHAMEYLKAEMPGGLTSVATDLMGSDVELRTALRWGLRAAWVERTPVWCFPWRLMLALTHWSAGALDRLPLVFAGSVPSLVSTMHRVWKNQEEARELRQDREDGVRRRAEGTLTRRLRPVLEQMDFALRRDLKVEREDQIIAASFKISGLDELQSVANVHQQTLLDRMVRPTVVTVVGGLGMLVFWVLFSWPLAALYEQLSEGARAVWEGRADAVKLFPSNAGSMLVTALFLALVPTYLFLLGVTGWQTRRARVEGLMTTLKEGHAQTCAQMVEDRKLAVCLGEARLNACALLTRSVEQRFGFSP